jgi:manganese/zinc/iron transport system permease protein
MNPYGSTRFFEFFVVLFKRLTGQCPLPSLATDEIQLLVLVCISISTVILGTFLTLRKMAMMANSLSHTTLLGIVICFLMTFQKNSDLNLNMLQLLIASAISGFLTIALTEGLRHFFKLQEDAAIGLVFTTLFALSILLVTLFTRSTHIGVEVITGNVDGLHQSDLVSSSVVAALNLGVFLLAARPWTFMAFDPQFSSTCGLNVRMYHYLQMAMTALTLVVSMRAVGALLVLSFLVGPVLIARHWTKSVISLLGLALAIAVCISTLGVALTRHLLSSENLPLSTGGSIVSLISMVYLISAMFRFHKKGKLLSFLYKKEVKYQKE